MTKKSQGEIITTVLLILLIFSAIVIVYQAIPKPLTAVHQDFIVEQNVCENATIEEYYTFPNDYEKIDCPIEILKVPCFDRDGNEFMDLSCKKKSTCWTPVWNRKLFIIELSDNPAQQYDYIMEGHLNLVGKNPDIIPLKNSKTEQTCSLQKVDEIDWATIGCLENGGSDFELCMRLFGWQAKEHPEKYPPVLASDLTEDWLNENCNPILNEPAIDDGNYHEGCGYRSSDRKYVCDNHDCKNGDYLDDCVNKWQCGDYLMKRVR